MYRLLVRPHDSSSEPVDVMFNEQNLISQGIYDISVTPLTFNFDYFLGQAFSGNPKQIYGK